MTFLIVILSLVACLILGCAVGVIIRADRERRANIAAERIASAQQQVAFDANMEIVRRNRQRTRELLKAN